MDKFLFRNADDQKLSLRVLRASMTATFSNLSTSRHGASLNRFGSVLRAWKMVNYWNSRQLARVACMASCSKAIVSEQEVKNILSGMSIHPSITLFKALAAIHREITDRSSSDYLLEYATPLSIEDAGNNPSWWFALYCDEEWAWSKIEIPLNWSPPEDLSKRLSAHLRKQITDNGKDVICDIPQLLSQSFDLNSVGKNRIKMWILGIRDIGKEEMHEYIHGLVKVSRLCGSPHETAYSLMNSI